jgi:hypothetical protein
LLRIELGPAGVTGWSARPLLLEAGTPRPADADTAAAIEERLTAPIVCRRAP